MTNDDCDELALTPASHKAIKHRLKAKKRKQDDPYVVVEFTECWLVPSVGVYSTMPNSHAPRSFGSFDAKNSFHSCTKIP